jgi:hypothetical protein
MSNKGKMREVIETIELFRTEDDVTEVRILNTKKGTVNGYFNDPEKLAMEIQSYVGKHDIYFTVNPVNPDLLARAKNRLQSYAKQTTTDKDIARIEFIVIDLDPVRAAGISSTEAEHEAAKKMAEKIATFLERRGFPKPIVADSGNGYHVLIYIELSNEQKNVDLVKAFLNALDFLFSDEKVQVDRTTYNPSRIVKLYGTMACKGDDVEERPHRWSNITCLPETLEPANREMIERIIDLVPEIEQPKQSKGNSQSPFDLEAWIEEKGLKIAHTAPFQNKGKKYVLDVCPWNENHTNRSAYIIHFTDGGVAAGCLHNSCCDENWQSLRTLLEPDWQEKKQSCEGGEKEKQSDVIIKLAEDIQYFINELEESYGAVDIHGHTEVMALNSVKFKLYLTKLYFEETNSAPSSDAMNQALKVLEMKAMFSGEQRKLHRRMTEHEGDYYYDMVDQHWQAVKISKQGCTIEQHPPILFTRNKNMKEQVLPDLDTEGKELLRLVQKHFRFKKESDLILFTVFLATCFVAEIAHVILVLFGEKGASKSTTMSMVKQIVDPAVQGLLSMPTSKQDLAIILANTYMPSFDNLDALSAEKSDMLCMAATGGAFSKRTLYSDADETILRFKRCVMLNGINVVATRSDLLDRSIVLELERIPKNERKTEDEVWSNFHTDLPKILGAIFQTLSKAMAIRGNVQLKEVGRMADFTYWGFAIAEVLDIGGDTFLQAYLGNQDRANEEAISSHPVAAAVLALMKTNNKWVSSISKLLKELEEVAELEKINTRVRTWPKDSHVLSKRLKEVKSNLEEVGIYYDIRHAGDYKKITIEKLSNGVESEEDDSQASIRQDSINQLKRRSKVDMEDLLRPDEEPA